jgi:hypothetical protein
MPGNDDFDGVLEVATDELLEIPEQDVKLASPPPTPAGALDLISDFLDVKPVRQNMIDTYQETSQRYIPFGPVPLDATTDTPEYSGMEIKINAIVEGFHVDYQKDKMDAEDRKLIAEVVTDCYDLAAQIDKENGKKINEPADFPMHSDEEVAGDGIEDLIPGLKK